MENESLAEKDATQSDDFAAMLAEHEVTRNTLQQGQKVSGTVIAVTKDSVFVDLGIKQDGVIDRSEFPESDDQSIKQGDSVEAWIVGLSSQGPRLSRSMTGSGAAALEEAKSAGIPVEGRIIGPCKGGYQVEVLGKIAFCPGSQMPHPKGEDPDAQAGRSMEFLVTRVEHQGRNIVVSRRALVEREREENLGKLLDSMKIGDIVEGTVARIASFGIFIELAPSVEGLAHISELSWGRIENAEEMAAIGDKVRAKIISMEKDQKGNLRLGLSLKQACEDPWEKISENFAAGDMVEGKVRRVAPFGAFIEIAPGIEGLAHISEFSWEKRVNKADEFLSPGQSIRVKVKEIDPQSRRLSLSIRDAEGDPWEDAEERYKPGQIVRGKIEAMAPLGYFIALAPGVTGLLPKSVISSSSIAKDARNWKVGDEVELCVKSMDVRGRRISLSPVEDNAIPNHDESWKKHVSSSTSNKNMGIMAQALQEAFRKKK